MARQVLIVIGCILLAAVASAAPDKGGSSKQRRQPPPQDQQCVATLSGKQPKVKQRFNDNQMAYLCDRVKKWTNTAKATPEAARPVNFTEKQNEYVRKVANCSKRDKGKRCLEKPVNHKCSDLKKPTSERRQAGQDRRGNKRNNNKNEDRWQAECKKLKPKPERNNNRSKSKGKRDRRQTATANATHDELSIEDLNCTVTRMEYRAMSDEDRNYFHDALDELKSTLIDGVSKYDLLVSYHTPEHAPGAHWGASFLPFHREYLKQWEVAMRTADDNGYFLDVYIPYWDSSLDDGLPKPADSIIWTPEFLGNGDGEVTTGPFANWVATAPFDGHTVLYREVGQLDVGAVYQPQDLEFAQSRPTFQDFTYCIDPMFELTHGLPHMFVGGHMVDLFLSPNDPSFMLHHCFIDYMWEQWRLARPRDQRETGYPANADTCNGFDGAQSQMLPFNMRNVDGMSNNYTDTLYDYALRPTCPTCGGSKYLFCNAATNRCHSKVRQGGACEGFEKSDVCLNGSCTNGVCGAASSG